MKKILSILCVATLAFGFSSCEDALDSENYTKANTGNFPAISSDLTAELNAAYACLNKYVADPLNTPFYVWNLMSDDCNGAGGTGDVESHAVGHLTYNKDDLYDNAWAITYIGISRANTIIHSIDNVDWGGDTDDRNQMLGEAFFLRGLYYLWGSQLFGNIPGYWTAGVPDPCPQQDAATVLYPHIFADFMSAASLMTQKTPGDGHATKYAAEAFLARAYMFYEGFYEKAGELATASLADIDISSVVGEQEGCDGALSKDDVIDALEDIINNGGYSLVGDYRDLWQYTNELTVDTYPFTSSGTLTAAGTVVTGEDGNPLAWAGNGNDEQIFQVQFANFASWNGTYTMGYVNEMSLYSGLRCDDDGSGNVNGEEETYPFGQGWGQGTVNAQLWDDWSDSDPRKTASILDAQSECEKFVFTTSCTEDAGYYNKKLLPVTCPSSNFSGKSSQYTWWACLEDGYTCNNGNSMQGDHFADMILMRLADVYLMHSELTGTNTYMNKVRERAGLDDVSYSWANIKSERRYELAFEGVRFNDLRRWSGIGGGASCEAALALEAQNGTRVNYTMTWTTMRHATSTWAQRYAETDGFLRIPPTQISLVGDESVLKQNAGWGSDVSDAAMTGTPVYI